VDALGHCVGTIAPSQHHEDRGHEAKAEHHGGAANRCHVAGQADETCGQNPAGRDRVRLLKLHNGTVRRIRTARCSEEHTAERIQHRAALDSSFHDDRSHSGCDHSRPLLERQPHEIPTGTKMSTRNTPTARRNAGGRLDLLHVTNTSVRYRPCETVFAQGDRCTAVMYIRKGRVKLTVTSRAGQEAVVAILRAGAFFGEGALAGQRRRTCTAETLTASTIATVKTTEMRRGLQQDVALADRFRSQMLARSIRSRRSCCRR
jgi:hypothetical protein